jgi:hypothetical protein
MPYGQEFQNQSLAQAMANQQNLVRQQQAAQALSQGGTGAGGLAGILGAALGGVMAGRKGRQIAEGEANINEQLAQYQNQLKADQAQKEAQALENKRAYEQKIWERNNAAKIAAVNSQRGYDTEQDKIKQSISDDRFNKTFGLQQQNAQDTRDYRKWQTSQKQPQIQLSEENSKRKAVGLPTIEKEKYDAQKKIDKENKTLTEKNISVQKNIGLLKDLQSYVSEFGYEPDVPFNREQSGKMQTLYENGKQAVRKLWDLGALQEGDKKDMEKALENPTSFFGWMGNMFGGGEAKLDSQLGVFIDRLEQDIRPLNNQQQPQAQQPQQAQSFQTVDPQLTTNYMQRYLPRN